MSSRPHGVDQISEIESSTTIESASPAIPAATNATVATTENRMASCSAWIGRLSLRRRCIVNTSIATPPAQIAAVVTCVKLATAWSNRGPSDAVWPSNMNEAATRAIPVNPAIERLASQTWSSG